MFGRQKIAALAAEFVGTAVLGMAVLSMAGRTSFPFFPAIIAGLTMGLMVLVFGQISGAHINPIVTLGLWTMRKVQTAQAVVYIAAQMLGGVAAWQLSEYLLNQPLRNNAGAGLSWRILVAEAVGGFIFTTAVISAVSRAYEGAKLAFTTGAGLTLGIVVASLASNGIVNPAVAVAIQSWSWAYALGPVLGAVIGMNIYGYLFTPPEAKKRGFVRAALARRGGAKSTKAKAKAKKKK